MEYPEHAAASIDPTHLLQEQPDQGQRDKERRLKALLADHSSFMRDRLASFVGRQAELQEIRTRIAEKLPAGGYITITGQAGQGKSSIIAKLVEEYGPQNVAYHFIPFNPGPDHQVGLLRNLMARLILKYDLSDLYVVSASRPALRDYLPKVLSEVVAKGGQEVIFVDGLDQLEEDFNGLRDLSFLPNSLPAAIVFVLGTRPNDTLRPLELLQPHTEYPLPNLSRNDFDLILQHRNVQLDKSIADQFYKAMEENALYLDLVAKELFIGGSIAPTELIAHIANNPENIFSLSMARLKRQPVEWREVIKPVLGVLLTALEPLSRWQIRQLIHVDDDRLRDGIARLGGLLTETAQHKYTLFHLKLQDYLHQHEDHPQKDYILATDEVEHWHATLATWCEQGQLTRIWQDVSDPREQGRREYARKHYLAHLYYARQWEQLFTVLDEGAYGQAKKHYDPSTRSYAQDLDLGRRAAAWNSWTLEEGLTRLPHLWRYTLLRCSLSSRADQYPLELFKLLLLLKREPEVLGLAELLTRPERRVGVLIEIARHLCKQATQETKGIQIFLRAFHITSLIEDSSERTKVLRELVTAFSRAEQWKQAEEVARSIEHSKPRTEALRELATALREVGQWKQAEKIAQSIENSYERARTLRELATALREVRQWKQAEKVAQSLENSYEKAEALRELATALSQAGQEEQAQGLWKQVEEVTRSIEDSYQRARALTSLSTALSQAGQWELAQEVVQSIEDNSLRARALRDLTTALSQAGQWELAQEVAWGIEDSTQKTRALRDLTIALSHTGQWELAQEVVQSIKDNSLRARALRDLTTALSQAGQWELAQEVAWGIEDSTQKTRALRDLTTALSQAGQWELAQEVAWGIEDSKQRTEALKELAEILATTKKYDQLLRFVQDAWLLTKTREYALQLLPLAFGFIRLKPELGTAFYDAFQWVDAFLKG